MGACHLLAALQPGMTVSADETTIENTTSMEEVSESAASAEGEQAGTTPAEEKTPEQIAEEERAKLEAEKQASLESQADTNLLPGWPQGPAVYAHSAVVMDMKSGAILYAKKPDEQHYPASITKIMTALVALENSELTDKVHFTEESVAFLEYGDASIGMQPGEEITMEDALYGMLLASANEVSYAIADTVGNGYDNFIRMMNEKAEELGCTNTHLQTHMDFTTKSIMFLPEIWRSLQRQHFSMRNSGRSRTHTNIGFRLQILLMRNEYFSSTTKCFMMEQIPFMSHVLGERRDIQTRHCLLLFLI